MTTFSDPPLTARFWGELACFTRPEMKVERVSYAAMTPSAARGALESVFWRPEFSWKVREILVLRPVRFVSMVRNEVTEKATARVGAGPDFLADDHRTQRHTLALRDVAYIVRAEIVLRPHVRDLDPAGYRDQFRRRLRRGQCFQTPYVGCREFPAFFGPPQEGDTPQPLNEELGPMLFDLDYGPDGHPALPRFFFPRLDHGVIRVPPSLYEAVGARRRA